MTELYIFTFDYLNDYKDYPILECPRPYIGYYKLVYVGPPCDINVLKSVQYDDCELYLSYYNNCYHRPYIVVIPVKNPKIYYEGQEVTCINQNITDLSKLKIMD